MNKPFSTRRLVLLAMYLGVSLILSYVESLIPLPIPIPGVKLGLANLVSVVSLITFGLPATLLIMVSRVFISGFLFGTMSAILYSLAGGFASILVMALLLRPRGSKAALSIPAVSVAGAVTHNLGQLVVAAIVIQNTQLLLYYLPFLVLLAIPTGLFIGFTSKPVVRFLNSHPTLYN
jgi:heptaprenyl diphosphate synthase